MKTLTDHSYFETKVDLRLNNLPAQKKFTVLDCFAGNGLIWKRIQELRPKLQVEILSIEKERGKAGVYLVGDNLRFLGSMDLTVFDVIDLDAYGLPYKQLKLVLSRRLKKGVIIYLTAIQSVYGSIPKALLCDLGYTPAMLEKIPTLFWRNGPQKIKDWLWLMGVRNVRVYSNKANRKNYLCFTQKEKPCR